MIEIKAVYDDAVLPLMQRLGKCKVSRYSNVEYDNDAQEWVAIRCRDGAEVARAKTRRECLEIEHQRAKEEVESER